MREFTISAKPSRSASWRRCPTLWAVPVERVLERAVDAPGVGAAGVQVIEVQVAVWDQAEDLRAVQLLRGILVVVEVTEGDLEGVSHPWR
jgi:hypothetical protein